MGELPIGLLFTTLAALALAGILRQWAARLREVVPVACDGRTIAPEGLSVVIPVRDEADTLAGCLQDLHAQTVRDRMEVMIVNDGSTDASATIAQSMAATWPGLSVRSLPTGTGKKAALAWGVREARHSLVLITDGDTRCGPRRAEVVLRAFAQAPCDLMLLPVAVSRAAGWCARFQYEEQCALLGVAAGSALNGRPLLANGANMAFSREAFLREAPRMAGRQFASGDDMFLLHAMLRTGAPIRYVLEREALVEVDPQRTWRAWWTQRLRWAGKMRAFPSAATSGIAALALALPWMLAWYTMDLAGKEVGDGVWHGGGLLLLGWAAWLFPTLGLVAGVKHFLGHRITPLLTVLALVQFVLLAPVIALLSIFVRPRWKGRRIR